MGSLAFPLLVLLLLGLGANAAATHGAWLAGSGELEPSTRFDSRSYMFQVPNQNRVDQIYFNLRFISTPTGVPATYAASNVDGGNVYPPAGAYPVATLGFWRDCNRDGYIGFKVAGASYGSLGQYSRFAAENAGAPLDPAICPLGSAYWRYNDEANGPSELVDELRSIGPCPPTDPWACDPRESGSPQWHTNDVLGNGTRVWGDWGLPGFTHVPWSPLLPMPEGALQDSEGTLGFVDAATMGTFSSAFGSAWDEKPNVGECDEPHPEFLEGPGGTCGLWPLHQVERLGNDSTCSTGPCAHPDPLVTVFDTEGDEGCDDMLAMSMPVDDATLYARLPVIWPDVNPNFLADGSVSGTLAHVSRSTRGVTVTSDGEPDGCADSGGDLSDNCGISPCEAGSIAGIHVRPSFVLRYQWATSTDALAWFGFDRISLDLGTESEVDPDAGYSREVGPPGGWYGKEVWAPRPPRHVWGTIDPAYTTSYADVYNQALTNAGASPALALPGGTQNRFRYGSDACASFTSGPSNVNPRTDWDCSVTTWNEDARSRGDPTSPTLADPYDLRDVDCYDNTLSDRIDRSVKLGITDCVTDGAGTHP